MNHALRITLYALFLTLCACQKNVTPADPDIIDTPPPSPPGSIVLVDGIANPDRGYHLEFSDYAHKELRGYNDPEPTVEERETITRFSLISIRGNYGYDATTTLVQLYIYLKAWPNMAIPASGLNQIQGAFDILKEYGYKAILRFAYNDEMGQSFESAEWVAAHMEQLRPLLTANQSQIAVVQAGFLGAWGEWHSSPLSTNQNARNAVVNTLLDIIPDPYTVQVREPRYKNDLTLNNANNKKRIGIANDYFTAAMDVIDDINIYGDAYLQVVSESPYFYMLGEIPYQHDQYGFDRLMNISKVIAILRDHHYSAFDITQNYELNITYWKTQKVYPAWLDMNHILYDPSYFLKDGVVVNRSFYEFVRDHLGYRLNMKSAEMAASGGQFTYNFKLTNTGFATIMNPREVYLVFINAADQIVREVKLNDVNPAEWQPFTPADGTYTLLTHTITGSVAASGLSGVHRVGLWLPDPLNKNLGSYDILLAPGDALTHWSDAAQHYRVNIVGEINF
jgi:hypothetical protein